MEGSPIRETSNMSKKSAFFVDQKVSWLGCSLGLTFHCSPEGHSSPSAGTHSLVFPMSGTLIVVIAGFFNNILLEQIQLC